MMRTTWFVLVALLCTTTFAKETLVKDVAEFDAAVKDAKPGDEIVLANGEWRDAELVFRGDGKDHYSQITLRAETPGKVVLAGKSRLRIGGEHLIVRDLLWRDADAEDQIVAFRIDSKTPARYCTLRSCAIVGDLPTKDRKWVSLYGDHNNVEACRFEGKQSGGTLLVVWLADSDRQKPAGYCYHDIMWNFFGPRSKLERNGGEIIRVGDSKTSGQHACVAVQLNYFFHCDGEAEIISNKSAGNTYRENTFVGCSGALTLRHGNPCVVHANSFFGDGRKGAGGVRVIGEGHKVTSNLFHTLTGDGTRAALSLMNGIPDSPLNGYFQVRDAVVQANTFIRCKESIVVGLRDEDQKHQTLPPVDCFFTENAVLADERPVFVVHHEPQRFRYEGNSYCGEKLGIANVDGWQSFPNAPKFDVAAGTTIRSTADGFKVDDFELPTKPADVGPAWMRPGDEYLPEVLKAK